MRHRLPTPILLLGMLLLIPLWPPPMQIQPSYAQEGAEGGQGRERPRQSDDFDIREYGAVNNDTAVDNAPAISRAIAAASAARHASRVVRIPAGRWYINSSIQYADQVSLVGDPGPGADAQDGPDQNVDYVGSVLPDYRQRKAWLKMKGGLLDV